MPLTKNKTELETCSWSWSFRKYINTGFHLNWSWMVYRLHRNFVAHVESQVRSVFEVHPVSVRKAILNSNFKCPPCPRPICVRGPVTATNFPSQESRRSYFTFLSPSSFFLFLLHQRFIREPGLSSAYNFSLFALPPSPFSRPVVSPPTGTDTLQVLPLIIFLFLIVSYFPRTFLSLITVWRGEFSCHRSHT